MRDEKKLTEDLLKRQIEFLQSDEFPSEAFRCYVLPNYPRMSIEKCRARARNPQVYEDNCGQCPKWKRENREWVRNMIPRKARVVISRKARRTT